MATLAAATGVLALLCLLSPLYVDAHAGHFHIYPDVPSHETRNYVRRDVGYCSNFQSLNSTSGITLTGNVTVWIYAYKNCSDRISTGFEFDTTMFQNGQPLLAYSTDGYVHSDTCANGAGAKYMQDAALGEVANNMIWWGDAKTNATSGEFKGNAANGIVARFIDSTGQPEANPMKSLVIYTDDYGATLCCDLNLSRKPAPGEIESQAESCVMPPPPVMTTAQPQDGSAAVSRASVMALLGVVALLLAMF